MSTKTTTPRVAGGKGGKGPLDEAKRLYDKHIGWKGVPLGRTLFSLMMFHWYGETAFVGALIAFFKPDIIDAIQPHFEKGIAKAQELPIYVWGIAIGVMALVYVGESKESHYFDSLMTVVNLFCYVIAAQVGADLAQRNIARAHANGMRSAVNNVTSKFK